MYLFFQHLVAHLELSSLLKGSWGAGGGWWTACGPTAWLVEFALGGTSSPASVYSSPRFMLLFRLVGFGS